MSNLMAIFGFVVILLLSITSFLAAVQLCQLAIAFGSKNLIEWMVVAFFFALSLGGFYLAYTNSPIEVSVKTVESGIKSNLPLAK